MLIYDNTVDKQKFIERFKFNEMNRNQSVFIDLLAFRSHQEEKLIIYQSYYDMFYDIQLCQLPVKIWID